MADINWMKRTVNTAGRPCPLLFADKCPGTAAGCAFWLDEHVRNATGDSEPMAGCLFVWQYVIAHETVLESVRTQASLNQTATTVREAGHAIVATVMASRRALAGA